MMILSYLMYLALLLTSVDDASPQFPVYRGRCLIAQDPSLQLTASSTRMCSFLCFSQIPSCISWSYRMPYCNLSTSVQSLLFTNDTEDCEWWSFLHQLKHVAFWPMSNQTRTRNVISDTGYLNLEENRPLQYVGDAVHFTGQYGTNERYNIDNLKNLCLTSLTFSAWVKPVDTPRVLMALLEGQTPPSGWHTQFWLQSDQTGARISVTGLPDFSQCTMSTSQLTTTVWNHIVGIYDKTIPAIRIYVNGTRNFMVSTYSLYSLTSCAHFGTTVQIGASARANSIYIGLMKCFGVSEKALSDSEVAQLAKLCQI